MSLFWAYSGDFSPRRGDSGPIAHAGHDFAIASPTAEHLTAAPLGAHRAERDLASLGYHVCCEHFADLRVGSLEWALRMAERIRTGMVWVNTFFLRDLRTPFGSSLSLDSQINTRGLALVLDTLGVEFGCDHRQADRFNLLAEVSAHRERTGARQLLEILAGDLRVG